MERPAEILYDQANINNILRLIENGTNRQKQFSADISFELRTMLTPIKGKLELLYRNRNAYTNYREKITDVLLQINHLIGNMDKIMLVGYLNSANLKVILEPVNLYVLTQVAESKWRYPLQSAGIRLHTEFPEHTEVITDCYLLELLLQHLLMLTCSTSTQPMAIYATWNEPSRSLVMKYGSNDHNAALPDMLREYDSNEHLPEYAHLRPGDGLTMAILTRLAVLLRMNICLDTDGSHIPSCTLHFSA